jgi:hypothetical protein
MKIDQGFDYKQPDLIIENLNVNQIKEAANERKLTGIRAEWASFRCNTTINRPISKIFSADGYQLLGIQRLPLLP